LTNALVVYKDILRLRPHIRLRYESWWLFNALPLQCWAL